MTTKQQAEAVKLIEELRVLKPSVKWVNTWNYQSKTIEFTAIKDGGVHFQMYKRNRYETVTQSNGITYKRGTSETYAELTATTDMTTRDNGNGMIVSGAHSWDKLPQPNITQELPRVSYAKYLQFIKDNLGILENIGA